MKTSFRLILAFLFFNNILGYKTINVNAQSIAIKRTFTNDTTFKPFTQPDPIYLLKVSGDVQLLSDSSLVRVVLIDNYGNHYLVFETYPLITLDANFSFDDFCDETCFLDGIVPDSIRIDLCNALLTIETLTFRKEFLDSATYLQAESKWNTDSVKISTMNQRISQENMHWIAGRSRMSTMSFSDKEKEFSKKFNLSGVDYCVGGVYERLFRRYTSPNPSTFVNSFDWRYRHGANKQNSPYFDGDQHSDEYKSGWLTECRDQNINAQGQPVTCGSCWAFATIAAIEARLNIFYNQHDRNTQTHYDIDLSEQQLVSCSTGGSCAGGICENTCAWLVNNKVVVDDCFPYMGNVPCNLCSNLNSVSKIGITSYDNNIHRIENTIKQAIIQNGPLMSGYQMDPNSYQSHAMLLIGWSTSDDGSTVWHFKNSWGYNTSDSPFFEVQCSVNDINSPTKLVGTLTFDGFGPPPQYPPIEHKCTDEDGDGYYWWGATDNITPSQCGCPNWVYSAVEDCDDNDKGVGPYNDPSNPDPNYYLFECKPNCAPIASIQTETINNSTNLSSVLTACGHIAINKNIVIGPTGVVTVNSTIRMHPQTSITIQPGGKLIIESTTGNEDSKLTSSCNQLWQGIIVEGTSDPQSGLQGRVEIYGTIESAVTAVKTVIIPSDVSSGAIIIADGAVFKDNQTAIDISEYQGAFHTSKFVNCTFNTNDTLSNGSFPQYLVKLKNLGNSKCLQFTNCNFAEIHNPNQSAFPRHTTGIHADNARFFVNPGSGSNSFSGLLYGIHSSNCQPSTGFPFYISGYHFTNIPYNIFLSGVSPSTIINNIFDVPAYNPSFTAQSPLFTAYGIYAESSSNFTITNNTMTGTITSTNQPNQYPSKTCGIYIRNSAPTVANKIYKNTIHNFDAGIASYGYNRNNLNEGLEIKCNDFAPTTNQTLGYNVTDIGVYKGDFTKFPLNLGIKYNQGVPNTSSSSESAGNLFSMSTSANLHLNDIFNTSINVIYYYHHNMLDFGIPPNLKPIIYSSNVMPHENSASHYSSTSSSCPDPFPVSFSNISLLQTKINTAKNSIDSLNSVLTILIDGGKTDSVNSAILFSMPSEAWNLYLDLMSKSPYLSDTVLKSSVVKEAVLINALLRDILVANPQAAKSDSILKLLGERIIPMSDSMMAEILEGRSFLGAKEIIEGNRANLYQQYCEGFNDLLSIYLNDTLHCGMQDSITSLFQNDFRLSSRYSLAFQYLNVGNLQNADITIQNIPSAFTLNSDQMEEYQRYTSYYACLKRAIQNNASLTFDSIQIQKLDSLVSTDTNFIFTPTVYARNALQSVGLFNYHEQLIYDTVLPQTPSRSFFQNPSAGSTTFMRIYPNPAREYLIFDYRVDARSNDMLFTISGVDGREINSEKLNRTQDQKVINLADFVNGVYIITLVADGKKVQSGKFIISK